MQCISTPVGTLTLCWDEEGLRQLLFPAQDRNLPAQQGQEQHQTHPALHWFQAYFAGSQHAPNFPISPQGTPFQQRVWQALLQIPYGHTWSYARLASHIGAPSAVRAVGAAVGRNPLPILIPCHRVIGSNGQLTGFSGGMTAKRLLLALEGIALDPERDRLAARPSAGA